MGNDKVDTGKGYSLKRLRNITCPYTGIKMLAGSELNRIESRFENCKSIREKLYVLSRYAKYMQPVEHRIYDHLTFFFESNPEKGLKEYFSGIYAYHLARLKLEEFKVIDSVDTRSALLSTQTQLELRRETTNCRDLILNSSKSVFFKRKAFLEALGNIKARNPYEERVLSEIMNLALFLPTSGSSESAFVIKYSGREEHEILMRLVVGSVSTIEHVKPHSLGGSNEISNFLMVSNNGNRYRENVPLTVYIDRHPQIPEYCQTYINEIIKCIHQGALKGNESYPYKISRTLFEQSEGRILLDLSNYRITETAAAELENEYRRYRRSAASRDN